MATAPLRACSYPGCSKLVVSGRCAAHPLQRAKPSYSKIYNTYAWQKARAAYLSVHPLCMAVTCLGRGVRTASIVDHIVPHHGDERTFWDEGNWQALCKECHDRKTALEIATRGRRAR